jgi:hypothetical protein
MFNVRLVRDFKAANLSHAKILIKGSSNNCNLLNMKYENFKQAKGIVEQIEKHQYNLNSLSDKPKVLIISPAGGIIYTIETDGNFEHEYRKQAIRLVDDVKTNLQNRIDNLKSMLELL